MNERIRLIRTKNGLTQDQFAEIIGITKSSVSLLESGRNSPSEQTIRAICEKFMVRRQWLLDGIEPMKQASSNDDFTAINEALQLGSENKTKLLRLIADMPDPLLDEMVKYFKDKLKDRP